VVVVIRSSVRWVVGRIELVDGLLQLVRVRDLVVPRDVVAHERDRVPLVGMGDHEGRLPRTERRRGEHVEQLAVIVAVHLDDGEAERGRLLIERVQIVGLPNRRTLLQPVAVDDHRQGVELVLRSGHHRLPVATLLQLSVADQDVRPTPRHVELGRDRVPDGDRQPVAERTGVGLDPRHLVAVRVAVQP
jgi:hypothetical protein